MIEKLLTFLLIVCCVLSGAHLIKVIDLDDFSRNYTEYGKSVVKLVVTPTPTPTPKPVFTPVPTTTSVGFAPTPMIGTFNRGGSIQLYGKDSLRPNELVIQSNNTIVMKIDPKGNIHLNDDGRWYTVVPPENVRNKLKQVGRW